MITVMVNVRVKAEQQARFLEAIKADAVASVRDEPGCLRFDVSQQRDDPESFWFYEVYADEAAFEAHRETPHYAEWRAVAPEVVVADSQRSTATHLVHTSQGD